MFCEETVCFGGVENLGITLKSQQVNHFTNTEHNIIMEHRELIPSSVKLTHIFVGQHPSG